MRWIKVCSECGSEFETERSNAITCSDVCRKRRSRRRQRITTDADKALEVIYQLARRVHASDFGGEAWRELEYIGEYAKAVHADVSFHQQPRDWQQSHLTTRTDA